jgi:hypothetical protein
MPLRPNELVWLISGTVAVSGALFYIAWLYGFRKPALRTLRALNKLASSLGLMPIVKGAGMVKYLHEYPAGNPRPQFAAGVFDGLRIEVRFDPRTRSSDKGRTMLGIHLSTPLKISAGLTHRDAASVITNSLFKQPNGLGTKPLFDRYDAWGAASDIQRIFTLEVQSQIRAIPRVFDQLILYGDDVVTMWPGVEEDVEVVKQAIRLASLLGQSATVK